MNCERGNLSPALIAFIVDQYLSRNQLSQTRASFHNEASSLFANAPPNQNLLSLEDMLNQYICMKKQNIELNKEKMMLVQEKNRIQRLLQDMQNAVDIFNTRSPLLNVATMTTNSALVPPMQNDNTTPPIASTSTVFPVQNTMSLPPKPMNTVNVSSPVVRGFDKKRKDSTTIYEFEVAKKPCGRPHDNKKQVQGINMPLPSPVNKVDFGSSSATTQSLVGNFATSVSHISTNLVSTTHPKPYSFLSDTRDVSPPTNISPMATCNGEVIDPSYNVISIKRVIVKPHEQMVYKEDNRDISPPDAGKKDRVDKTSMRVLDVNSSHIVENLDKSFPNKISISESEKKKDDCAHLDSSNRELEEWLKIDFSKRELEDWLKNNSQTSK